MLLALRTRTVGGAVRPVHRPGLDLGDLLVFSNVSSGKAGHRCVRTSRLATGRDPYGADRNLGWAAWGRARIPAHARSDLGRVRP